MIEFQHVARVTQHQLRLHHVKRRRVAREQADVDAACAEF